MTQFQQFIQFLGYAFLIGIISIVVFAALLKLEAWMQTGRIKRQKANNATISYPLYGRDGKYVKGRR